MKIFLIATGISILFNIVLAIIDAIHKAKHEKLIQKFVDEQVKNTFKK